MLSVEEVGRLLEAAPGQIQGLLGTAYGAGLRVSEVASLKIDDIDSTRMLIRVEQGKGRKDRNAMLSPQLLTLLRLWWKEGKRRGVIRRHHGSRRSPTTGAHRTWLDPTGRDKAPVETPRRAMGYLRAGSVRRRARVMAAGEGIETMLSLRGVMRPLPWSPRSPPITSPPSCFRQHFAGSMSPATRSAATWRRRFERPGAAAGIEALTLLPAFNDFNEDLPFRWRRTSGGLAPPARARGCGPLHGLGDGRDGIMCPALRAADGIGS